MACCVDGGIKAQPIGHQHRKKSLGGRNFLRGFFLLQGSGLPSISLLSTVTQLPGLS